MKKLIILLPLLSYLFYSCGSWIDVQPDDRMAQDELFSTRNGFEKAISGIYVELAHRNLYGRQLSVSTIDILGQYYTTFSVNNVVAETRKFQWLDETNVRPNIDAIWNKMYNVIINTNVFLQQCDEKKNVLPGFWYGLLKGEALALRAFMHFDLQRLFGPVYYADPDGIYIPYSKAVLPQASELISPREFMGYVIGDLEEAIALLKEADPVFTQGLGVSEVVGTDNSLKFRPFRMNYFAAKMTLTRAYLWIGNKDKAYELSTELLKECEGIFEFGTDFLHGVVPDRLFSSEVIFAACDQYRESEVYDKLFNPRMSNPDANVYHVSFPTSSALFSNKIQIIYEDMDDLRLKGWASLTAQNGNIFHYNRKFDPVVTTQYASDAYKQKASYINKLLPLMRLSELHLIAAETAPTLQEGLERFDVVRKARSAKSMTALDEDEFIRLIEGEYRRDLMSEGQMFYFYKRLGMPQIMDAYSNTTATVAMSYEKYVAPMPKAELENRRGEEENEE